MKITVFLALIFLSGPVVYSQLQFDKTIEGSFERYKKAVIEADFSTLLERVHPNIIKLGGGSTYFINELKGEYNMYDKAGIELKSIVLKTASKVVKAGNDLQAMVPYIKTFSSKNQLIEEKHFYLATSFDNGANWVFTDMKKYSVDDIKTFIPNYNERLNIYVNSINH